MANYIGDELTIFEHAHNWKRYYAALIHPVLGKRVAEIGAGIGGSTSALCNGRQEQWVCVEPDPKLLKEINRKISDGLLPPVCTGFEGVSADLTQQFDSLLYIDVIEHIKDDKSELETAAGLLKENGCLVIIVPAHQSLFSPFDAMIGHYRRYSRGSLQAVIPSSLTIEKSVYLDSVGYFASLVNRLFLKQSMPGIKQVKFWDRFLVPVSKITDRLLGFGFGKSVLLIARKKASE